MPARTLYVGDIGGTHVRFATVAADAPKAATGILKRAGSRFDTLADAIAADLAERPGPLPAVAVLAVAGAVTGARMHLTNRAWTVDPEELKARFGFTDVMLVNDFAAMARGAALAPETSFRLLAEGRAAPGAPLLVAGPGTGLGMATLLPTAEGWRVLPGEGGHIAYAPRTAFERAVVAALGADLVTAEEIAAGAGFPRLVLAAHAAVAAPGPPPAPETILAAAAAGDAFAAALCQLRAHAVMRAGADAALVVGARGGLVLAGGVAEALAAWLAAPDAIAEFRQRGPGGAYLAETPVRLLHDQSAPLLGAAALYFDQWTD